MVLFDEFADWAFKQRLARQRSGGGLARQAQSEARIEELARPRSATEADARARTLTEARTETLKACRLPLS